MDTLIGLLCAGELDGIALGASKNTVMAKLGSPDDVSVQKNPEILKYGSLELTFYRSKRDTPATLQYFRIDFRTNPCLPERLSWIGWRPGSSVSVDEFTTYLQGRTEAIERQFTVSEDRTIEDRAQVRLEFDSGAFVLFQNKYLAYVGMKGPSTSKNLRQVTVLLADEVVQNIREKAVERQVSVSALCAEWIAERAHVAQ